MENGTFEVTTTSPLTITDHRIDNIVLNVSTRTATTPAVNTTKKHNGKSERSRKNQQRKRKKTKHENELERRPDQELLSPEHTCLMSDVCMRKNGLGYCYKPHKPWNYSKDDRDTEDFYDMLIDNCPHFFDANGK